MHQFSPLSAIGLPLVIQSSLSDGPRLHVRILSESGGLDGRRQGDLGMISCLPVQVGVNGRPASSRDEEKKYSEWVSK